MRGRASGKEKRRDQTDRQIPVQSSPDILLMEGVGTSPDHPWRDRIHKYVHTHTHTHTRTEKRRKSKTPQASRKTERELEGKAAGAHERTHSHMHTATRTHTHRAGVTDTLEATFNEAQEGGGARGSEMKTEVGWGTSITK